MRAFGLHPDDVLARAAGASIAPPRSLADCVQRGAVAFGLVSVIAYSIWAFKLIPGAAALYATIAAVYVGLAGLALGRLVAGPGTAGRFALLLAAAFAVYAIIWCAFWFGLKGKYHADFYGAAFGLAAMAWMLWRAFGARGNFLAAYAALFTLHSFGYYLGDDLHALVSGTAGRLLWGAAHGIGFGAGLGYLLHQCQEPLRERLRTL